jgi:hypothetical protein
MLMKRHAVLALLASLLLGPAVARTQETYTIKLKDRAEGEAAMVKRNESTVTKVKVSSDGKVLVDNNISNGINAEYKETLLKGEPGKPPVKFQRDYTKVQTTDNGKTEEGALQGMSVIIEKKDKGYEFTNAKGEKLDGPAAVALAKEFNKNNDDGKELEKLVMPKGAVKVGDSWKIDMAKIATVFAKEGAMELDTAKATGQGSLVKAYKKDGRQFGDMKFKLEMPLQTVGKGVEQMKFMPGAKVVLEISLDACIDGTSETGTMKMKMVMSGNAAVAAAPGATASLNVVHEGTQIQMDAAKK